MYEGITYVLIAYSCLLRLLKKERNFMIKNMSVYQHQYTCLYHTDINKSYTIFHFKCLVLY